jgi:hypothetical protein
MRKIVLAAGALVLAACAPTTLRPSALPGDPITVAAAGDISCPALSRVVPVRCQQAATAAAVADADFVVALGDLQYPGGTTTSWNGYDASWGALAAKTLPVIGNHEWLTPNAQGFYDYWASKGNPQTRGVWSRPLGNGWTFIGLDANCGKQDCKAELLALDAALFSAGQCAIVGWHQPRWSSGHHGSSPNKKLDGLWSTAVAHGVPLVLNGHEHNYERTTPFGQTTEVVVGTGGKSMDAPTPPGTFTAKQIDSTFGHLRLTLTANNYTAEYRDLSGAVLDSFSGTC